MKKILFSAIVIVIVAGAFIYYQKSRQVPTSDNSHTVFEDSVVGCYVATLGKDVYSLKINSQTGESFEGTLVFKNFEKDSSSGPFVGTFKDGILLGDYSFQSEGTYSIMQVIFKRYGGNFIRGYGPVNETGDRFADINNITYDSNAPFKVSSEPCAIPL